MIDIIYRFLWLLSVFLTWNTSAYGKVWVSEDAQVYLKDQVLQLSRKNLNDRSSFPISYSLPIINAYVTAQLKNYDEKIKALETELELLQSTPQTSEVFKAKLSQNPIYKEIVSKFEEEVGRIHKQKQENTVSTKLNFDATKEKRNQLLLFEKQLLELRYKPEPNEEDIRVAELNVQSYRDAVSRLESEAAALVMQLQMINENLLAVKTRKDSEVEHLSSQVSEELVDQFNEQLEHLRRGENIHLQLRGGLPEGLLTKLRDASLEYQISSLDEDERLAAMELWEVLQTSPMLNLAAQDLLPVDAGKPGFFAPGRPAKISVNEDGGVIINVALINACEFETKKRLEKFSVNGCNHFRLASFSVGPEVRIKEDGTVEFPKLQLVDRLVEVYGRFVSVRDAWLKVYNEKYTWNNHREAWYAAEAKYGKEKQEAWEDLVKMGSWSGGADYFRLSLIMVVNNSEFSLAIKDGFVRLQPTKKSLSDQWVDVAVNNSTNVEKIDKFNMKLALQQAQDAMESLRLEVYKKFGDSVHATSTGIIDRTVKNTNSMIQNLELIKKYEADSRGVLNRFPNDPVLQAGFKSVNEILTNFVNRYYGGR